MEIENRRYFSVSSDSSGILGRPKHWRQAWGFAEKDTSFGGFETLAWGGPVTAWTNILLEDAQKLGIKVNGLHGRTGGIHESYTFKDRVILEGLNRILIDTPNLVGFAPRVDYILVHGPELRDEKLHGFLKRKKNTIKSLYVENHLRPGADGTALSIARDFRRDGINAGVMFDLFHYIRYRNLNGGFEDSWASALDQLSWLLTQKDSKGLNIPIGIHVPMGWKEDDSLPVETIKQQMWKDLGGIVKFAPDNFRVVVENQQKGLGLVFPVNLEKQTDRNKKNLDILRSGEVI